MAMFFPGYSSGENGSEPEGRKEDVQTLSGMPLPCHQGTVYLGGAGSAVEFQVRCKPVAPREKIGIELSVARLRGGTGVIKSFRRHPLILKAAGGRRQGFCFRDRHEPEWRLYCEGEADGSVLLKGRVWVGKVDPCDLNVALTSFPKRKQCEGSCPLALGYAYEILADGAPRGC